MSSPKYSKFNTGRTKEYFPLLRWRFNTVNHPVIQSAEKCASSTAKSKFSMQELQMLVGLTNTLQCNEREAVRIALYEAAKRPEKAHETAFTCAASQSTEKGHQGRSSLKQWKLPKAEKQMAFEAAKELGISDSEFIRMAVIWLQRGIRNGTVDALTNSKLIPFDAVARTWSRENPGSKAQGRVLHPGVAKLKQAAKVAYEEAGYINEQRNKEKWALRKAFLRENSFELPPNDDSCSQNFDSLDALIEIQEAENFERIVQDQIEKLRLNEREAFDFRWLQQIPDLTEKELEWLWDEQLAEAKEQAEFEERADELMKEFELICKQIRDLYTPKELEEQARKRRDFAEAHKKPSRYHCHRYRQDLFEVRLKHRLDELFDGRA